MGEKLSGYEASGNLLRADRPPWRESSPERLSDLVYGLALPEMELWRALEDSLGPWDVRPVDRLEGASGKSHVLAITLGQWRTFRENPTLARADFLPSHLFWLEHGPSRRLGILRMAIETIYTRILQSPGDADRLLDQLFPLLEDPRLASIDADGQLALRTLALGHRARLRLLVDGPAIASAFLSEALDLWPRRGESEARARLFEIEADIAHVAGRPLERIEKLLDKALDRFSETPSSRRAEAWIRRGLARLRHRERLDDAEEDFRTVLDWLREGHSETLRLEAIHRLVVIALNRRDPRTTRLFLNKGSHLYERYGHSALRIDRLWAEAQLAAIEDRLEDAFDKFRKVTELWLDAEKPANACRTVLDWLETAARVRNHSEVRSVLSRYKGLFDLGGPAAGFLESRLESLAQLVVAYRPDLAQWIREISKPKDKEIVN